MLSTVTRTPYARSLHSTIVRSFATETVSTPPEFPFPPSKPPNKSAKSRSSLYPPHPRPAVTRQHRALPNLPPTFGRNQLLPVSNSTRALLESIVAKFDAPIRYAFAYGSGVFEQDGYSSESSGAEAPMLDFMFAVTHSAHFHSINMHQHPSHYPLHARTFGSSYVTRLEQLGPGVWFNAYVPVNGVVSVFANPTSLVADLLLLTLRQSNMASRRLIICAPIYSTGVHSILLVGCTNPFESSRTMLACA